MEGLSYLVVLQKENSFDLFALLVLAVDGQRGLARLRLVQGTFRADQDTLGRSLFFGGLFRGLFCRGGKSEGQGQRDRRENGFDRFHFFLVCGPGR